MEVDDRVVVRKMMEKYDCEDDYENNDEESSTCIVDNTCLLIKSSRREPIAAENRGGPWQDVPDVISQRGCGRAELKQC